MLIDLDFQVLKTALSGLVQREPFKIAGLIRIIEMVHRAMLDVMSVPAIQRIAIQYHTKSGALGYRDDIVFLPDAE